MNEASSQNAKPTSTSSPASSPRCARLRRSASASKKALPERLLTSLRPSARGLPTARRSRGGDVMRAELEALKPQRNDRARERDPLAAALEGEKAARRRRMSRRRCRPGSRACASQSENRARRATSWPISKSAKRWRVTVRRARPPRGRPECEKARRRAPPRQLAEAAPRQREGDLASRELEAARLLSAPRSKRRCNASPGRENGSGDAPHRLSRELRAADAKAAHARSSPKPRSLPCSRTTMTACERLDPRTVAEA